MMLISYDAATKSRLTFFIACFACGIIFVKAAIRAHKPIQVHVVFKAAIRASMPNLMTHFILFNADSSSFILAIL